MAEKLPYQLSWLQVANRAVREVLGEARNPAARDNLIQSIRALDDRLRRNPREVGVLSGVFGVIERRFLVAHFLRIDFSVDTQRNMVAVRSFQALWRGNGKASS